MTSLQDKSRGAALIVAILVLAILLIIVLSFFQASRQEVNIATNYRNATQADLLAEGGTAIAIAFLNHDRTIHPTVTSIDHAWKTYFNGAWAVGKPALWKFDPNSGTRPFIVRDPNGTGAGNNVPVLDLDDPSVWNIIANGLPNDRLYIPRIDTGSPLEPEPNGVDDNSDGVVDNEYLDNPFAVNYPYGISELSNMPGNPESALGATHYGPEQIHYFADWDNDEDGLRDSAWIPMPMDKFADVPVDEPGDGIDNDLDGLIDEGRANGIDEDGDGNIDEEDEIAAYALERELFLYWGGDDGLDNDGDGTIDEVAEQKPFLTTPFPPLDLDGDGVFDVTTYASISVQARDPNTDAILSFTLNPSRGSADVDRLDNDYNLVINDSAGAIYTLIDADDPSLTPEQRAEALNANRMNQATGFHAIDTTQYPLGFTVPANGVVTFSGEPVCELVGRAAILVKDENSKVNMNAAGGRNFRDVVSPYVGPESENTGLRRALWTGASTNEYETRVLPQVGDAASDRLWNLRTGAHAGIGLKSAGAYLGNVVPTMASYGSAPLDLDISLPGFGRVDDNGNALWMAMDGIDNDGDGLVDEGLADLPHWDDPTDTFIAPNNTMDTDEAWTFEGIDEPQEFQTYRPYRNKALFPVAGYPTAEEDGLDNAAAVETADHPTDNSIDEIGELGDRYLRSTEQLKLAETFVGADFDKNRNLVTVNGTDLNSRFQHFDSGGNLLPSPVISGPKLDYNYATAEQIAVAIMRDWGYVATPPTGPGTDSEVQRYALGLRREDTAISLNAVPGILDNTSLNSATDPAFPPDKALRAAQLAVNIRDNRDPNLGQSTVTTSEFDRWWADSAAGVNDGRSISYTQAGIESIRINEIMARPVRRVEAEMQLGIETDNTALSFPAADFARFNPNAFSAVPAAPLDFNVKVETNDTVPAGTTLAWQRRGALPNPVIGERSYISGLVDENNPTATRYTADNRPRIVQFRFAPSPGLPPVQPAFDATGAIYTDPTMGARYYLTANTMRLNPVTGMSEPTVRSTTDMRFVVKYGPADAGILDDMAADPAFDPFNDPLITVNSPVVGYRNMSDPTPGSESGWVFLPSDEVPNPVEGPVDGGFYNVDEAYTVHIPPYNLVNPAEQMYLYVAVWFGATDPDAPYPDPDPAVALQELAINFFDFSQEPDHEWMELVNIAESGPAVDLSNWQISIGADRMKYENGGTVGPTLLTIPSGTWIAPGGSILLGFNKYDPGRQNYAGLPAVSPLLRNGIALARAATGIYEYQYVTEPPIPGYIPNFVTPAASPYLGEGMFLRGADYDFLDSSGNGAYDGDFTVATGAYDGDGDGTNDTNNIEAAVASSLDTLLPFGVARPTATNKAWDRIVEVPADVITSVTNSADSVAMAVLSGGVFPNYPEHDGLDNDGDELVLANDGVDNDGDGIVDEQVVPASNTLDDDGDGIADELGETNDPIDRRVEGIDEGRWEYITNNTGVPLSPLRAMSPPGSYSRNEIPYIYRNNVNAVTTVDPAVTPAAGYIGSEIDPPEWKAFVERRWYTPDNVPVTLYAGQKADGRIADRITYSERDVINRATDDILSADLNGDGAADRPVLNEFCFSFWPDNTMGVDFYRSIERKHPLYNGDLHGLSNRWQATDGYYDDWSPSTSVWERNTLGNINRLVFDLATGIVAPEWARFTHAFSGSPLRMNLAQRYIENPDDQFGPNTASANRWAFERVRGGIRNRNYTSPGDLASLASYMDTRIPAAQPLAAAAAIDFDDVKINYGNGIEHTDDSIEGIMLAQHPYDNIAGRNDMTAVMGSAAMDPLVLAAGTANVYTIVPDPATWNTNASGWTGNAATAPALWSPVFLFPIVENPTAAASFPLDANSAFTYSLNPAQNFLFTGPYGTLTNTGAYPASLDAASMAARWPLKLRATMYAANNPAGFDPDTYESSRAAHELSPAATALFEWDGGDGLENGDYDVYIMTADNLAPLEAADARAGNNYLTDFGRNLVNAVEVVNPRDTVFDVEMFTDRNYTGTPGLEPLGPNGRCWVDDGDNYPQLAEFERGNALNEQGDSFSALLGLNPDEDGVIYYGTVRVENNYLALLLRNWTAPDKLARFSRVILTPHQRTSGRLNINTVESAVADYYGGGVPDPDSEDSNGDLHPDGQFNPLIGVPGILMRANTSLGPYIDEGDMAPLSPTVFGVDGYDFQHARAMADQVVRGRETAFARPDGRYYDSPSDLIAPYFLGLENRWYYLDLLQDRDNYVDPADPGYNYDTHVRALFDEASTRYSRLANLATTRSDVFEITVTAQTGYLSSEDLNGDGRLDYRNDFIVTGEKKIRTVYER